MAVDGYGLCHDECFCISTVYIRTYPNMSIDRLAGQARNTLQRSIKMYLRDLVQGQPIWLANDWDQRTVEYQHSYQKIIRSICSTCQYESISGETGGCMNIHLRPRFKTEGDLDQYVAHLRLPSKTIECLEKGGNRIVWVCVNISWYDMNHDRVDGHTIIMMFDTKRKVQVLFDPAWGFNWNQIGYHLIGVSNALMRRQFHPRCTPVNSRFWTWPRTDQSLQFHVEKHIKNTSKDEGGLCGILSILVMLTCIRFNYYNPKDVADMMVSCLTKRTLINELISWYEDIRTTNDREKFIEKIMPISTENICRAFSPSTGRLCKRPSCTIGPARCMCWQHRALIMNCNANSKKCGTKQASCT